VNLYGSSTIAAVAGAPRRERPATGILFDAPEVRLVVFRIQPGQQVAAHTSPSVVILSVMAGSGLVTGATGERAVRTGDVVVFAPLELHAMRAVEEPLVLVATIAPRPGGAG
jgi:quercetin dioxygenase-like cupin family protein